MNVLKLILTVTFMTYSFHSYCQTKTDEEVKKETKIEFEIFKEIPKEIDGCACYFSKTEIDYYLNEYIFVNDFANIAYIKIKGILEKFERVEKPENKNENTYYVYKKGEYELTIEITKKTPQGEESSILNGKIILTKKNTLQTSLDFFGTCGC